MHQLIEVIYIFFLNTILFYRFKSLPGGKPFNNKELRKELEELVIRYQRRSNNLVNLGSTQANENFNHIVASKAPKSR